MMTDSKWRLVAGLLFWAALTPIMAADSEIREIPFQLKEHYIVVQGAVGELHDLNFVLDTGATFSWVTPRISRRLGQVCEKANSVSMGHKIAVLCVVLNNLRVGGLQFHGIEARVAKLPFVWKLRIDALIGLNLLRQFNVLVDYENKKLSLDPSEPLMPSQSFNPNLPFIMARMKLGNSPVKLLLDTGAGDLIIFKTRDLEWRRIKRTKFLSHVGGRVRMRSILLSDVSVRGTQCETLKAYTADISPDVYGGLHGILGVKSLGMKRLQLGFPKGRLGWER